MKFGNLAVQVGVIETNGKSLQKIRREIDVVLTEGEETLDKYNNYQSELSDDIRTIEKKLKKHGVKTPYKLDFWNNGEEVLEWKFFKPDGAKTGRFRLCYNGTPLLEKPFEYRAYAHPYFPAFYRGLIERLRQDLHQISEEETEEEE